MARIEPQKADQTCRFFIAWGSFVGSVSAAVGSCIGLCLSRLGVSSRLKMPLTGPAMTGPDPPAGQSSVLLEAESRLLCLMA
jgi:hypothetical protein